MTSIIIVAIISYLIGSIMFSVIFTKKIAGFDVRTRGSGNAGSTNVLRTAGKKVAIITLICDILKGVVAVLIGYIVGKLTKASVETSQMLILTAGVMVVLGHTFPIFFKFKGGKGVATSLGVLLMINWKIGLICLVFALLINLFSICIINNGSFKNGIIRINISSNIIPSIMYIHQRKLSDKSKSFWIYFIWNNFVFASCI